MKWLSILTGLLLVGCAQPNSKDTPPSPAFRVLGENVTIEPARSDESIGWEVRARLDRTGATELAGVIVQIEDGIVTLRGSAPNRQATWRAEGAARAVPGVKKVINAIQLTTPGSGY
ncbi:MAG: hypothetical protein PCFJNLEI_00492 [Verrucomicrobiae bacterium]|nr:hypothetical protein [Verrucomicrobiae bacterium]